MAKKTTEKSNGEAADAKGKTSKKASSGAGRKGASKKSLGSSDKKSATKNSTTKSKSIAGARAAKSATSKSGDTKTTSKKKEAEAARPSPSLTASRDEAAQNKGGTTRSPKPRIEPPPNLTVEEPTYGPLSESDLRGVKTGLTKKHLAEYRRILLEKRAEIVGDVEGMEQARASGTGADQSHMPLHMADAGSDQFDQEFTLGLMESEQALLQEIDEALIRIGNGTYGVCLESGQPIHTARLEITPWAKYCIEVARRREGSL